MRVCGLLLSQLGDLCDAEDALTEANVLNNLEPEVWAYLCLLCLDTERDVEAEQAYKYTLKVPSPLSLLPAVGRETSTCRQSKQAVKRTVSSFC